MNKQEFLTEIGRRLEGFPPEEIERSKEYFLEMIEDRMEDGMSEGDIDEKEDKHCQYRIACLLAVFPFDHTRIEQCKGNAEQETHSQVVDSTQYHGFHNVENTQ